MEAQYADDELSVALVSSKERTADARSGTWDCRMKMSKSVSSSMIRAVSWLEARNLSCYQYIVLCH